MCFCSASISAYGGGFRVSTSGVPDTPRSTHAGYHITMNETGCSRVVLNTDFVSLSSPVDPMSTPVALPSRRDDDTPMQFVSPSLNPMAMTFTTPVPRERPSCDESTGNDSRVSIVQNAGLLSPCSPVVRLRKRSRLNIPGRMADVIDDVQDDGNSPMMSTSQYKQSPRDNVPSQLLRYGVSPASVRCYTKLAISMDLCGIEPRAAQMKPVHRVVRHKHNLMLPKPCGWGKSVVWKTLALMEGAVLVRAYVHVTYYILYILHYIHIVAVPCRSCWAQVRPARLFSGCLSHWSSSCCASLCRR